MTSGFEDYVSQARAQSDEAAALIAPLSDEALGWRPAPGRWSVGECIVHLSLTIPPYIAAIEGGVAEARARGLLGREPWRGTWIGRMFLGALEPPPRMRVPATRRVIPLAVPERDRLVADFRAAIEALVDARERAEGVDLGRARVRSPFFPLLRISADESFRVLLAHNRRHFWQARQVIEQPGRPR